MAQDKATRRVRTVPFRMSFPSLLEPRQDEESGRRTYQLSMLFPPGTDLAPFRAALKSAMVEKFGSDQTKWPRIKHGPDIVIKDFDNYNATAKTPLPGDWKNWILVRASCTEKSPPSVVGPTKGPDGKFPVITDPREVYGGRWARATIDAYHFDVKGKNSGVTFGLGNVQLLKADTPFGFAKSIAESDFDDASEEWAGQGDAFEQGGEAPAVESASDWG